MEKPISYTPPIAMRDNQKRSKDLVITFWILIGVSLVALVFGYLELELLEKLNTGGYYTDEELNNSDLRQGIIGITQTILTIILAILFIRWLRRAYVNAGLISTRKLGKEDHWVVWGFIIPIISLWYPFSIASEINNKMNHFLKSHVTGIVPSAIGWSIGLWWALYLIRSFFGNAVFRMSLKDETLEQVIAASEMTIFADMFDIPAALVTLMMILKMTEKENKVREVVTSLNAKNSIYNTSIREEE